MERTFDAEKARQWVRCQAHAALTALTAYALTWNEFGYLTWAIPDSGSFQYHIVVPLVAVVSGDWFLGLIAGQVDDMVTPSLSVAIGHAVEIHDGLIADQGADPTGAPNEFGLATTASVSATALDTLLFGERVTGTT
jgi:hypothetical protein